MINHRTVFYLLPASISIFFVLFKIFVVLDTVVSRDGAKLSKNLFMNLLKTE